MRRHKNIRQQHDLLPQLQQLQGPLTQLSSEPSPFESWKNHESLGMIITFL